MSGGRETPRQKMIGMMYLFYTALLALQVDTTVLEKFILINKTLERQIEDVELSNAKLFSSIAASVEEKGNRPDDKRVLDQAQKVRNETIAIISEMNTIKENIVSTTGGYDEGGRLVGAKNIDEVATLMIQQGKGKEMKLRLNGYAIMLGEETKNPENYPPIARDAKDIPQFATDPNNSSKPFAELYFLATPTGAGMATLSQLESEVLQYETRALKALGERVGIKDINFDQVFPLIRPESKIVAVGGKYRAEMFIAASSSAFTPEMAIDGEDIPVDTMSMGFATGIKFGKIEFSVTGGGTAVPGEAYKRKVFKADITMADSVYTEEVEYFVITPVMQVSSRALSALWRNCANELSISVPALGTSFAPKISASNSDVIQGQGGNVTLIPTSNRKVIMTVRNAGVTVGTADFRVKNIPLPSIEMRFRDAIDLENGVTARDIRGNLTVEAIAEANFASDVPKDAKYRVEGVEINLVTGSNSRGNVKDNKGRVSMRSIQGAGPKKGDFLIVKITRISRINYKGLRERISTRGMIYTIKIN